MSKMRRHRKRFNVCKGSRITPGSGYGIAPGPSHESDVFSGKDCGGARREQNLSFPWSVLSCIHNKIKWLIESHMVDGSGLRQAS